MPVPPDQAPSFQDRPIARLAALIENADDAMVSKTLDGTILTWNRGAERIFGYSAEEIVGQTIYRLVPDHLRSEEEGILSQIAQGEHVEHYETTRLRKDGILIPIELSISPVKDASGTVIGASSIKRDISERRRLFQELARIGAIVDSTDDAVVSKSLDGTVLSWNPAAERIFGYSAEEMIGRPIFRLVPPHLVQEEEEILARIAQGEHVAHYETLRVRKDGKQINISLTISPVRDSSGTIIGAASIKRDITERKLSEMVLRQSAKMEAIGKLAGGLAHDFNNQLHAMTGFLHFIERDPQLMPATRQDLLQVQKAAERMASLTRQLLAFARQQVLAPETLDLDAMMVDVEPMLQRLIGSNMEISIRSSPGPKWVRVDRAQMVQVLLNLVINARDAMAAGGRLTVETMTLEVGPQQMMDRSGEPIEPGAYARLTVTDTGEGIPPEHLGRIFEPFYTTKEVGQGTGLGLATVEGIVSQSGGYLSVLSALGQGTSITVMLPLTSAPRRPVAQGEQPRTRPAGQGRILVVDDDPHVRAVVTRVLRSEGYDVTDAANGKEALEVIEQGGGGVDVVVTDLVMPVMGGREFAAELHRRYPRIPYIMISGHPREHEGQEPIDSSIAFLQKPVSSTLLLSTVADTLRAASSAKTASQSARR